MVKNSKKYIFCGVVALVSLLGQGCKDDNFLSMEEGNGYDPETPASDMYYMALRIYNAGAVDAGSRSRAMDPTFDSDGNKDYGKPNEGNFNIGLASENAIYTGGNKETSPNFLLVFGKTDGDGDLADKLEFLLPLFDWDYEINGENQNGKAEDDEDPSTTSGYTNYNTFYTSANRYELPESFDSRKVLIVLNAGAELSAKLKSALHSHIDYASILEWKLGNTDSTDSEFLFYESPDGTPYFTMSSSIVVPRKDMDTSTTQQSEKGPSVMTRQSEKGPSVVKWNWDNTWCKDKKTAAEYPMFSFFVERLHSKFTLTIKETDKYCYFTQKPDATADNTYKPLKSGQSLVISSRQINPSQTIKYINTYNRRNNGNQYDEDHVKQYINVAEEWKINLIGWGVNGLQKQEYLFKNIDKDQEYYGLNKWNPENYSPYRNFWAEDPLYDDRAYPDQYRQAKKLIWDTENVNGELVPSRSLTDAEIVLDTDVKDWTYVKKYYGEKILNYYTFNSLIQRQPHQYSAENTYDLSNKLTDENKKKEAWVGRDYLRAGTHLILGAQLLIDGLDPSDVFSVANRNARGMAVSSTNQAAPSKYYMNGIYWSSDAYREYVGEYLGYWMQEDEKTFGHNNGILYVLNFDENHNPIFPDDLSNLIPAEGSDFEVERLMKEGSDSWVHVIPKISQLRSDYLESELTPDLRENLTVFFAYDPDNTNDDGSPIFTPITMNTFEKLALSHPEYFARHFSAGRMYYSIPVTHYEPDANSTAINPGRYGAVRNHWYNFTVNSIKNVGTAVDDPDQDLIIPNNDHSYDALGITLSVLPWHYVNEKVDITDQRKPGTPDEIDLDLLIKANDWDYQGKEEGL